MIILTPLISYFTRVTFVRPQFVESGHQNFGNGFVVDRFNDGVIVTAAAAAAEVIILRVFRPHMSIMPSFRLVGALADSTYKQCFLRYIRID